MTAYNHVLTGTVIATAVPVPWISLPLALASHFVLDSLPHYDSMDSEHTSSKFLLMLAADTAVAASLLVVIAFLRPDGWYWLAAAGILAASPDLMWLPRWVNELGGKINPPMGAVARFHSRIQKYAKPANWYFEFIWPVFMAAALVLLTK